MHLEKEFIAFEPSSDGRKKNWFETMIIHSMISNRCIFFLSFRCKNSEKSSTFDKKKRSSFKTLLPMLSKHVDDYRWANCKINKKLLWWYKKIKWYDERGVICSLSSLCSPCIMQLRRKKTASGHYTLRCIS